MASNDQSYLRFGPLRHTGGWDFTVTPGVGPSSCVVTFQTEAIEKLENPVHDLVFSQGGQERFRIRDCHLVRTTSQSSSSKLVKCTILDWRWRWQYAYIDGVFNVPNGEGKWKFEKTPRELATLLLEAMGEEKFDVSQLPDDTRPYFNWQSSRADAALLSLCGSLGCYPVPNFAKDRVEIHKIGSGEIPDIQSGIVQQSRSIGARPLPGSIRVVGGPSLFQTRLKLEAMGIDTDGKLKKVEDLSFIKKLGDKWKRQKPGRFIGIRKSETYKQDGKELKVRDLASNNIYRLYRVSGQASFGDAEEDALIGDADAGADAKWSPKALLETEYKPEKLDDILPLRATKVSTHEDDKGELVENDATIHGLFSDRDLDDYEVVDGTQYPAGLFTVDGGKGLVKFSRPIYLRDPDTREYKPAEIRLDTSYPVNKDGVFVRWEEFRNNSEKSAFGDFRHPVPDLFTKVSEVEDDEVDNREEVGEQSRKYITELVRRFESKQGREFVVTRILPVQLNGVVRQVTWAGGGGRPHAHN